MYIRISSTCYNVIPIISFYIQGVKEENNRMLHLIFYLQWTNRYEIAPCTTFIATNDCINSTLSFFYGFGFDFFFSLLSKKECLYSFAIFRLVSHSSSQVAPNLLPNISNWYNSFFKEKNLIKKNIPVRLLWDLEGSIMKEENSFEMRYAIESIL